MVSQGGPRRFPCHMSAGTSPNERRLGVAVIGAGRWGKNLIRVFGSLGNARLVSVCDVDRTRLMSVDCEASKASQVSEILSDPMVDAVVIATPPSSHAELAVACLEAGKHVFVEKPMALSSADARRIVRAAHLSHRRAMVGLILHYHPAVEQLRQWLDAGVLGPVQKIFSCRTGLPEGDQDPNPWWSLGPHDVSLSCLLLRRDPQSISRSNRVDASTAFDARLEFEGGCTAEISVATGAVEKVRRLVVVGAQGIAVFDDMRLDDKLVLLDLPGRAAKSLESVAIDLAGLHRRAAALLPRVEPLRIEAAHFARALLTDTPFLSDVVEGARVVELLEAGRESLAHGGRPVLLRSGSDGDAERFEDRVAVAGRVQETNGVAAC